MTESPRVHPRVERLRAPRWLSIAALASVVFALGLTCLVLSSARRVVLQPENVGALGLLDTNGLPADLEPHRQIVLAELCSPEFAAALAGRLESLLSFEWRESIPVRAELGSLLRPKPGRAPGEIHLLQPKVALEKISLRQASWVVVPGAEISNQEEIDQRYRSEVRQLLLDRTPQLRARLAEWKRLHEQTRRRALAIARVSGGKVQLGNEGRWPEEKDHLRWMLRTFERILAELETSEVPVYFARGNDFEDFLAQVDSAEPGSLVSIWNTLSVEKDWRRQIALLEIALAEQTAITWLIRVERPSRPLDHWLNAAVLSEHFEESGVLDRRVETVSLRKDWSEEHHYEFALHGTEVTAVASFDSRSDLELQAALCALAKELPEISPAERRERESFAPGRVGDREPPPYAEGRARTPEQLERQRIDIWLNGLGIFEVFDGEDPRHRLELETDGIVIAIEGQNSPLIPYAPYDTLLDRFAQEYFPLWRKSDVFRERSEFWEAKAEIEMRCERVIIESSSRLAPIAARALVGAIGEACDAVPCQEWRFGQVVRFELREQGRLGALSKQRGSLRFLVPAGSSAEELADLLRTHLLPR